MRSPLLLLCALPRRGWGWGDDRAPGVEEQPQQPAGDEDAAIEEESGAPLTTTLIALRLPVVGREPLGENAHGVRHCPRLTRPEQEADRQEQEEAVDGEAGELRERFRKVSEAIGFATPIAAPLSRPLPA